MELLTQLLPSFYVQSFIVFEASNLCLNFNWKWNIKDINKWVSRKIIIGVITTDKTCDFNYHVGQGNLDWVLILKWAKCSLLRVLKIFWVSGAPSPPLPQADKTTISVSRAALLLLPPPRSILQNKARPGFYRSYLRRRPWVCSKFCQYIYSKKCCVSSWTRH